MGTGLSLNGLAGVWTEAVKRNEPTITFELRNGRGRFLFLMFFDPEDESTKDKLLLFLQNSRQMLHLKLYGAHRKGDFTIYLNEREIDQIKRELAVTESRNPFDIARFIETLNHGIPTSRSLASKIQLLQANKSALRPHLPVILDDHLKTELVGPMELDETRRPREKTLRKLYLYGTQSPEAAASYIETLKKRNCTLRWREPIRNTEDSIPDERG